MSDFEMSKRGMTIGWPIFARWAWKIIQIIFALALGGHIVMTRATQEKQDKRLDKLDQAIERCLEQQNEKATR